MPGLVTARGRGLNDGCTRACGLNGGRTRACGLNGDRMRVRGLNYLHRLGGTPRAGSSATCILNGLHP